MAAVTSCENAPLLLKKMYVLLEHTKRQVKVFQFLSRNAFIFPYVYHRSLLFVSSWAKMAKKQKYLYDSVLVIIKNSWFAITCQAAILGVNTTEFFLEEFTWK